jgi:K+-sensing histidine kinase KdpD
MSGRKGDERLRAARRGPLSALAFDILWAAGWVAAAGLTAVLLSWMGMPLVAMIFLAAVIFTSVGRGVRSGVVAAIGAFAAYDYFWVPPVHIVQLRSPYEVMALSMFLGLALTTALSSGGLRDHERRSAVRQRMLLAFARAGGIVVIPKEGAAAGARVTEWVHEIVGTGVYYLDADGSEARAGDAATWWDTVQSSLPRLAAQAAEQPRRTHRSGDLRARALYDCGVVLGTLIWLSPHGAWETRRETDDFVEVVTDLVAAALGRVRRHRTAA